MLIVNFEDAFELRDLDGHPQQHHQLESHDLHHERDLINIEEQNLQGQKTYIDIQNMFVIFVKGF